jgi:HlyD family secretion protein
MKNNLTSFIKKPLVYTILILIVIGLVYMYITKSSVVNKTLVVQPSVFVQEVAVTGKVVAAEDVSMGFEVSGRVSQVNVKVGDKTTEGKVLAALSSGDAYANVLQRQAILDSEIAKYEQVKRGSRQEDLALAESDRAGTETTYKQNMQALVDQIKDSYSKIDDITRTKVDQLYTNPRSVNPEVLAFDDYKLKLSVNDQRLKLGETLVSWQKQLAMLDVYTLNEAYIKEAHDNLVLMRSFLNDLSNGVSTLHSTSASTQAQIDGYQANISAGRTAIGLAINSLSTAEQSYRSSKNAAIKAEQQLTLKINGSTPEDIASQAAQVKSARAQLANARAALNKTVIAAPFSGLVTKVDIKEGEIASPNTPVISLISASSYEMESYISENDISKVKVGQIAKVTLDSYGKDVIFTAKVVQVDPAETVVSGASTYKIKLQFDTNDERIRSGMTANITIETASRPASIIVPQEAVFLEAGEKVVTVESEGKKVNKKVETGGINTAGEIEIVSGLAVGDKIIIKQ